MSENRHPLHDENAEPYLRLQMWVQVMAKTDPEFAAPEQLLKMMHAIAYRLTSYLYDEEIIESLMTVMPHLRSVMAENRDAGETGCFVAEQWRPLWDNEGRLDRSLPLGFREEYIEQMGRRFADELDTFTIADLEEGSDEA